MDGLWIMQPVRIEPVNVDEKVQNIFTKNCKNPSWRVDMIYELIMLPLSINTG